jgi:hypothetical protein
MRRLAPIAVVALALLPAQALASTRSRARPARCPPGHSRTIAADRQAQVFLGSGSSRESSVFLGCAYGRSHSYVVGGASEPVSSTSGSVGTDRLTLVGTIVAREESSSLSGNPFFEGKHKWFVVVTDLRNGRVLHSVPTGTLSPPRRGVVGSGETTALVLKSDGAVAWIVEIFERPGEYEVHALDGSGGRVLAAGRGIVPNSLALAGSTLFWTQDGKPTSAFLN